jgi:hypothetical protein
MSPVKEPSFFNNPTNDDGFLMRERFGGPGSGRTPTRNFKFPRITNFEEYSELFDGVTNEKAIGEASVLYICVPGTAGRIKEYVPDAKIVALLRNPADRAYSAFLNAVRGGREPLNDFSQALEAERKRIRENWHYVFRYRDRGLYYEQIKSYYEVFGKERVGIWLYEELKEKPFSVMQDVYRFLGVDEAFVPDTSSKHNPASVPRNEAVRVMIRFMHTRLRFIRRMVPPTSQVRKVVRNRILSDKSPEMAPEVRRRLLEDCSEDILKLQELTGQDFVSAWLR